MTFELVCKAHIDCIIRKLGISGVLTQTSSWRSSADSPSGGKAQIDIVIDKSYEQTLRKRMSLFQEETKTRKTLLTTFITTFEVKPSIHSGIVQNEVTMDDLF